MPGAPFTFSALGLDLSSRLAFNTTVVASPAAAAETIIGSVTVPGGLSYATGCYVVGWAAYTVGTNGVSVQLRIRQTQVAGTLKADSGATTATAANLGALSVHALDTAPADSQVYKLTMQVASGSAASTVSAVMVAVFAV